MMGGIPFENFDVATALFQVMEKLVVAHGHGELACLWEGAPLKFNIGFFFSLQNSAFA